MVGAIAALRRRRSRLEDAAAPLAWRLQFLPVCASTERELDRWLRNTPPRQDPAATAEPADQLLHPRAVLARRQRHGHGQQARPWQSPAGGVWLSAALPWPADPAAAAAPGLAVAVALARQLEHAGVPVALKWPNDLLLLTPAGPRKLAGLLPGLRLRSGRVRWARIGLGLNGRNPVPPGAADLRDHPTLRPRQPLALTAWVLSALEQAIHLAPQPERVRAEAEALLQPPGPQWLEQAWWQPGGLEMDGGLRVIHPDGRERVLRRF